VFHSDVFATHNFTNKITTLCSEKQKEKAANRLAVINLVAEAVKPHLKRCLVM